jgi:hypothetical protein
MINVTEKSHTFGSFACPVSLKSFSNGHLFGWKLGFWRIVVGPPFSAIAAVPGFIDSILIPEKHPAEKAALFHLPIILAAVDFFIGSLLLRIHDVSPEGIKMYGS